MSLIKIQPSSLNVSATYTVAGLIADGVNIKPTLVNAYNTANAAFTKANQVGDAVTTANNNIANLSGALSTANGSIGASFDKANQVGDAVTTANNNIAAAFLKANQVGGAVTTANGNITASFDKANQVGDAVSTANGNIAAAFLKANQVGDAVTTANNNIASAFLKANQVGGAVTTANASIAASFDKANQVGDAVSTANGNITAAFLKANQVGGAVTTANGNIVAAFDQANTALYIANLAFDAANTGGGGGGSANIAILDEGTYLTNTVSSINFVGSAVTASNVGNDITVTITGGGGGGSSITTSIVTGTTQTAVKDYRYVLTNTSVTTVTLPATPTLGDSLYILVANALSNNVVDRNGTKLMGLDEDMIIDIANSSIGLVYVDTTLGWRLI